MDTLTPEQRHKNMQHIRSKDTMPEVWLRKKLFERGYRFRKNVSNVPGSPDIWLAKYNTAIFVHGCFWHRHEGCKFAYMPKSRVDFWNDKFQKNIVRDKTIRSELTNIGVKMLIVWECTVKLMQRDEKTEADVLEKIEEFLQSKEYYLEV